MHTNEHFVPSAGPCGFNLCRNTLAWPPQVHFWLILGRFDHLSLFWGVACVWDIFRLVVSYVTVYLWLLVWSQSSAAFHWEHLALAKHCCLKALFVIEQSNDTWFVFWTYSFAFAELTFGFILDSSLGPAKHVSLNTSWNQCLVTGHLSTCFRVIARWVQAIPVSNQSDFNHLCDSSTMIPHPHPAAIMDVGNDSQLDRSDRIYVYIYMYIYINISNIWPFLFCICLRILP